MVRLLSYKYFLRLADPKRPMRLSWQTFEPLITLPEAPPQLREYQPFVLDPAALEEADDFVGANMDMRKFDYLLDLPFEKVWLETLDDTELHSSIGLDDGSEERFEDSYWFSCGGMAVTEIEPGDYWVDMLGSVGWVGRHSVRNPLFADGNETPTVIWRERLRREPVDTPGRFDNWTLFCKLQKLFEFSRGKGAIVGSSKGPSIAEGKGARKRFRRVKDLVHITLTARSTEYAKTAGLPAEIDWSHKWRVRGHWRRVDGVGKDRTGSYCVKGATWVAPHVKGKSALVEKTRLVRGARREPGS